MITAVSDKDNQVVHMAFQPVAIGTIEEIDGKKYKVVDNTKTILVTYEEVEA